MFKQNITNIQKTFEKIKSEYDFDNCVIAYDLFNQSDTKTKEYLINELNDLFQYFLDINIKNDVKEILGGYCWRIYVDVEGILCIDFVPQSISEII